MRYENPYGFGKCQRKAMEAFLTGKYVTNDKEMYKVCDPEAFEYVKISTQSLRSVVKTMRSMGFVFGSFTSSYGHVEVFSVVKFKPIAKDRNFIHPLDRLGR